MTCVKHRAMYFQDIILALQRFWAEKGCVIVQPYNSEVGAGTYNPATFLRALGPEPDIAVLIVAERLDRLGETRARLLVRGGGELLRARRDIVEAERARIRARQHDCNDQRERAEHDPVSGAWRPAEFHPILVMQWRSAAPEATEAGDLDATTQVEDVKRSGRGLSRR